MTIQSWLVYVVLVVVATLTPGPAVLCIVTNSSLHGWRKAVFAALGNIAGLLCLGVIAVTGLGTLLKTSELVFNIVKYAGSAYLIFLGCKLIIQKNCALSSLAGQIAMRNVSASRIFFQAFGVAMSNPKAIVFLTALFPQFINVDHQLVPQFILLIATLMVFSFSFLMLYALLAYQTRDWLSRPSRVKAVNCTSGSLFICFGVLLAASSKR